MGDRDSGISRHRHRRGYPRHYLVADTCLRQGLGFLTPSPQHKRVAALESHHGFPFPGFIDQQPVYLALGFGVLARSLTHVYFFHTRRRLLKQVLVEQVIVDHYLGFIETLDSF